LIQFNPDLTLYANIYIFIGTYLKYDAIFDCVVLIHNILQGWHRPVSSVVQGLRTDGTRFYRVKSSSNSRLSSVRWAQDESRRLSGPFRRDETISYRTKNGRGRHRTRDGRNRRNRIEQWCHRVMSRDMVHYMWKLNMFC